MYLRNSDVSALGSLFWYALRQHGVFALEGFPSYMTLAHSDEDLAKVIDAIEKSLQWMVESQLLVEPRKLNLDQADAAAFPLAGARRRGAPRCAQGRQPRLVQDAGRQVRRRRVRANNGYRPVDPRLDKGVPDQRIATGNLVIRAAG